MLLGDVMTVFLVVAGFLIAMPALWLLCRGLWPERVTMAAKRCDRNLLKPFLAGVPLTLGALILVATVKRLPAGGGLAAAALACTFLVFASVGVSALTSIVGERLAGRTDERPMQATLRGSAVLVLSYLIPVVGWFLILPASIVIGAGAAALSFLDGNRRAAGVSLAPAPSYRSNTETGAEFHPLASGK